MEDMHRISLQIMSEFPVQPVPLARKFRFLPPLLLSFFHTSQDLIKSRMGDICCGVAKTYGGEIQLDYEGLMF